MMSIEQRIAEELHVNAKQVQASIQLLDEGATVPFISRYRKEVTGGLDDTQLRTLAERLNYLRELEERRITVLNSIEEQGKLNKELKKAILAADSKTRLEDLYLPYKPKRRTKGQIAIEAGLEPLADELYQQPTLDPQQQASNYLNADAGFTDNKSVLDGAKYILIERFAEDAELVGKIRNKLQDDALLFSTMVSDKEQQGAKFRDYFDFKEPLNKIPSHRALAIFRGRKEGHLLTKIDLNVAEGLKHPCETIIAQHTGIENQNRPADVWLADVINWTWRVKLQLHMETELQGELRQRAEDDAIQVFAHNLKDLLLAAPAGQRACIGLDPGLRTGVKVAVIDNTGQLIEHCAIYPHAPQKKWQEAIATLAVLAQKHQTELIAIGNGTASRETDKLALELIKQHPELKLQKVMVNEAGASIYSASELASREFPGVDVTIRGAASIGRRLQDPLAELVKIEPKSIGVGQYQHDVNQLQLSKKLDAVVEDCVNAVGVEVNTASSALLSSVAGLNNGLADNIVSYRNQHGRYQSRQELLNVPRLGGKTFEQAAGFLRIQQASNPLDSSAVHPESYELVERIAKNLDTPIATLIGNKTLLRTINPADYADERFGIPTITDIIAELEKPGRDPRPEFQTATFKEGVEKLSDLKTDMILEGSVTNVTNFGAFVDIGVHQDGLVHISVLSDNYVKDPHQVVKAGQIVKVKVIEVDIARKRISLSMRLNDKPEQAAKPVTNKNPRQQTKAKKSQYQQPVNAFAEAFAQARQKR